MHSLYLHHLMGKSDSRKELILEAALNEFVDRGYADVQVNEIAHQADTSPGFVFFHFPSKERIFLALMDQLAVYVEQKVLAAIEDKATGMLRVEAALEACLAAFSKHRRHTKILMVQAIALGPAFDAKCREIQTRFARHIQGFLEEAVMLQQIPPVDSEVVAAAWTGAIYHLVMTWVHAGEPEKERIRASLVPMLLHSVQYPASGHRSQSA